MTVTVMITTGGTGGHIFPGLSVAAALQARGARVFWLGTRDGMEKRLVPAHGVEFEAIDFGSVRGKGLRRLLFGPFAIASACVQAWKILRRRSPQCGARPAAASSRFPAGSWRPRATFRSSFTTSMQRPDWRIAY